MYSSREYPARQQFWSSLERLCRSYPHISDNIRGNGQPIDKVEQKGKNPRPNSESVFSGFKELLKLQRLPDSIPDNLTQSIWGGVQANGLCDKYFR